ncbi:MAG: tetraacyldisaccharide 4'-kinase [Luminiphilus sp.]|nr:tetraacyldisaccharide 4'-kinase [Luminiphilus sp.]
MSTTQGALERLLNHIWYGNSFLSWCLIPLTWPVRWVIHRRRQQAPPKGSTPEGVTVIVVGGLTAGGTGKTPVLIGLGKWLAEQGCRVGVVSRGYGGTHGPEPHSVTEVDTAAVVGDEPLLIRRELDVPVVVCADRKRALDVLVDQGAVDVVLSDDGLQHYPMPRDIELLLLDAERGLGNGRLLPAGPLREPASRLTNVDVVLERNSCDPDRRFSYQPSGALHLASGRQVKWSECVAEWRDQSMVAMTGLGQPRQFFEMLRGQGLAIEAESLGDHEAMTQAHLDRRDEQVLLMTAKDAVKLPGCTDLRVWVVAIEVALPSSLLTKLTALLPSARFVEA